MQSVKACCCFAVKLPVHSHTAWTYPWCCRSWQSDKSLPEWSEALGAWAAPGSYKESRKLLGLMILDPAPWPLALVHAALLISLSQWARQGWCQVQCMGRRGLRAVKQMLYQHLLNILKLPPVFLLLLNFCIFFSPHFQQQFSNQEMAATSFLWS